MEKWPIVFIVLNVAVSWILGGITLWQYGFPSFDDPMKGFEPRGTAIRGWEKAVRFLNQLANEGKITWMPTVKDTSSADAGSSVASGRRKRDTSGFDAALKNIRECASWPIYDATNVPRVVLESTVLGGNLMNVEHIKAICRLEQEYISPYLPGNCSAQSLPLYIGVLMNKTCATITGHDVYMTHILLQKCAPLYYGRLLSEDCHFNPYKCTGIPYQCYAYDAVFKILHYFTDKDYMNVQNPVKDQGTLRYSVIYFRREWYRDQNHLKDFFLEHMDGKEIQNTQVKVVGMQLDVNALLFNAYAMSELVYFGVAMGLVIVLLLFYLRSIILTIAVVVNVVNTLLLSYFLYYVVLQMKFFPFMNLLTGILLIAVGCDDTFIIYDLWRKFKRENPEWTRKQLTRATLRHGAMPVFITSLTTSAALFASVISRITTVRCFGIFAGVSVLVNFVLMITWIPAVIHVVEWLHFWDKVCGTKTGACRRGLDAVERAMNTFWSVHVAHIITKYWAVFLVIFSVLGIAGVTLVAKPGLALPTKDTMQFFGDEHHIEKYRSLLEDNLRFEVFIKMSKRRSLYAQVLWGVEGKDNGDYMDPYNVGELVWKELDVYTPEAQEWHIRFCHALKEQKIIREEEKYGCYFEIFRSYMEGKCELFISSHNRVMDLTPCCNQTYPFDPALSKMCISKREMVEVVTQMSDVIRNGGVVLGAFYFDAETGEPRIFADAFESVSPYTLNYLQIHELYTKANGFLTRYLEETAPDGRRTAGFVGMGGFEFALYDVQDNLVEGTYLGIIFSLILGFVVLLFTSLNILVTVYAILNIGLSIAVTVGVLVLLNWELNISESIIITLSVGLAIDFSIHYGVTYQMSKKTTRKGKVTEATATVGSAVSMAALTTFVSGLSMLPSKIIIYEQFGIFLMLIMTTSWLYATFFFLPLCASIGPTGNVGNLDAIFLLYDRCYHNEKNAKSRAATPPPSDNESAATASDSEPESESEYSDALQTNLEPGFPSDSVPRVIHTDIPPPMPYEDARDYWSYLGTGSPVTYSPRNSALGLNSLSRGEGRGHLYY